MKKFVLFSFICIVFAGCENFLENSNFMEKLQSDIDYAVAQDVLINVDCLDEEGSITSDKVILKKQSDEFMVVFKKNYGFRLEGWKAYSRSESGELTELSENYVKVLSFNTDSNDGTYSATIKLLKAAPSIVIKPFLKKEFFISEYYPSDSSIVPSNTSVMVRFSQPVNLENVTDSIKITSGGQDVSEFFTSFALNEDSTVLTVYPMAKKLSDYIKTGYACIDFSFPSSVCVMRDGENLSLLQGEKSSFKVYYSYELEKTPPVQNQFFLTKERPELPVNDLSYVNLPKVYKDSENKLLNDSSWASKNVENAKSLCTNGTVYICGAYSDSGSGVRSICVTESLRWERDKNSREDTLTPVSRKFTMGSDKILFWKTDKNITEFCVEYELSSKDGLVSLDVSVEDGCENSSEIETYLLVKKTSIEPFCDPMPYNVYEGSYDWDAHAYFYYVDDETRFAGTVSHDLYNSAKKTVRLHSGTINTENGYYGPPPSIYDTVSPNQGGFFAAIITDYEIFIEYIDRNSVLRKEAFEIENPGVSADYLTWKYELDVDSVSGLDFKIIVNDPFGNSLERNYTYPGNIHPGIKNGNEIQMFYDELCRPASIFRFEDADEDNYYVVKDENSLEEDKVYYAVPYFSNVWSGLLLGDMSEAYSLAQEISAVPVPAVSRYEIEKTPNINIMVYLEENTYDSIYVKDSRNEEIYSENGCTGFTVMNVPEIYLTRYNFRIEITGIKNGFASEKCILEIPMQDPAEFDKDSPTFEYKISDDLSSVKFTLLDKVSGPEYGIIGLYDFMDDYLNGNIKESDYDKRLFKMEESAYTRLVPFTRITFDESDINKKTFTVWVYGKDKKDNYFYRKETLDFLKTGICLKEIRVNSSDSSKYDLIFDYSPNSVVSVKMYKRTANGGWTFNSKDFVSGALSTKTLWSGSSIIGYESFLTVSKSSLSFDISTVNASMIMAETYINNAKIPASPSFVYTGTVSESGNDFDFIFDAGANYVGITSNAPVYAYSVYAPENISYEICKDWSVEQWACCYKDSTRLKPQILEFDSNAKPRKYTFPGFSIYDDYGLCGAVIVCFHGGYRCVSRVFEYN